MEKTRFTPFRAACLLLCGCVLLPAGALGVWQDGVYQDVGTGYRGSLVVTATIQNGQITEVTAQNQEEPADDFLQTALDGLRPALLQANSAQVDTVSGATVSSKGILAGVSGALEQASAPPLTDQPPSSMQPSPQTTTNAPTPSSNPLTAQVFAGFGSVPSFRVGPGKDANGVPVYSVNVAMASCLFDAEGRILHAWVDVYEVATPNYDGASMPHFSGWPARQGYNITDPATGQVFGVSMNTEQNIGQEVSAWVTKRERGASYGMNPPNEWYQQMNFYQQWMVGKTPQGLRQWFAKFTSPRNGRPIQATSTQQEDIDALAAMDAQEKAQLADVVSGATMSLEDAHGFLLQAIEKAYENRQPVQGIILP